MSRILLADDSPHAQRMGERILREEGHTVVTVSDGDTAMLRIRDVQPELILADITMPNVSGYELCRFVKSQNPAAIVVLTAGAMEPFDEDQAKKVQADGMLKKPFEATSLLEFAAKASGRTPVTAASASTARQVIVLEPEQVRAAITVALDESWEGLVEQITQKVVAALLNAKR